jgi:hypothetical protein
MSNNIKIPLSLLAQTINLLEQWDTSSYDPATQSEFNNVYYAFLKKKQSLELRNAYANIIFAGDEDSRLEARLQYLQKKRYVEDF